MKNKTNFSHIKRWISLLFSACLLFGLLSIKVVARGEGQKIHIPFGQDISDYDPQKNGYYGYIPTCCLRTVENVVFSVLPVFVVDENVLVDLDWFRDNIYEVGVTEEEAGIWRIASVSRQLTMTDGRTKAHYSIVGTYIHEKSFYDDFITLSCAPLQFEGKFWVPLADVFRVMEIRYTINQDRSSPMINLIPPRRQYLDVMADLVQETYIDVVCFSLKKFGVDNPKEVLKELLNMSAGTGISLGTDKLMRLELSSLFKMINNTNIQPFIEKLADLTQREYLDIMQEGAETADFLMTVANIIQNKTGSVLDWTNSITGLWADSGNTLLDLVEYDKAFATRDQLMIDSLNDFVSESGHGMSESKLKAIRNAVEKMNGGDFKFVMSRTIQDNFWDLVTDALDLFSKLKGFSEAMPISILSDVTAASTIYEGAEKIVRFVFPDWANTMSAMESFEMGGYGLQMQHEAWKRLNSSLNENLDNPELSFVYSIRAAYLFLKTCEVTNTCMLDAFGIEKEKKDQATSEWLERDLTILINSYKDTETKDQTLNDLLLPASSKETEQILATVVPLYMRLTGKVLERESNVPVDDAHVVFSCLNQCCGWVDGTPEGILQPVYVPVAKPEQITEELTDTGVDVNFSSPTVYGEDTVLEAFVPAGQCTMRDALLGDLGTIVLYYDTFRIEEGRKFNGIIQHLKVEGTRHSEILEDLSKAIAYRYDLANETFDNMKHFAETGEMRTPFYRFTLRAEFYGKALMIIADETYPMGRHDSIFTHSALMNTVSGKPLTLQDLFVDETAEAIFQGMLEARLEAEDNRDGFDYTPSAIAKSFMEGKRGVWMLQDNDLVVNFGEYEIGPYYIGTFSYRFSLKEDLADLVRQEFIKGTQKASGSVEVLLADDPVLLKTEGWYIYGGLGELALRIDGSVSNLCLMQDDVRRVQANYLNHAIVWLHGEAAGNYHLIYQADGQDWTVDFQVE